MRSKQKSADGCKACPRGYYGKYSGSKECDVCRSGFYNNQTSASICAECVSGRYLSSTTGMSCMGDDLAKMPHMARIAGSVYDDVNASDYYLINREGDLSNGIKQVNLF